MPGQRKKIKAKKLFYVFCCQQSRNVLEIGFWFAFYCGSIKKSYTTFHSFEVLVISVACYFLIYSGVYRIKYKDSFFRTLLLIEKKKFLLKCLKIAYT